MTDYRECRIIGFWTVGALLYMSVESHGGMIIEQGKLKKWEKNPSQFHYPPQIPLGLAWASAMRGRSLNVLAMAQPIHELEQCIVQNEHNEVSQYTTTLAHRVLENMLMSWSSPRGML
jgi:hypothetical protein